MRLMLDGAKDTQWVSRHTPETCLPVDRLGLTSEKGIQQAEDVLLEHPAVTVRQPSSHFSTRRPTTACTRGYDCGAQRCRGT
jgi:hypothetical protein